LSKVLASFLDCGFVVKNKQLTMERPKRGVTGLLSFSAGELTGRACTYIHKTSQSRLGTVFPALCGDDEKVNG
jgi:hypothetical protein